NGASWKQLAAPSPGGSLNSDLGEIYCLTANDCLAVGVRETKAKHIVSFTERWDGSRWKLGTMPSVRGKRDTILNDVSCMAPGTSVAVGFSRSSSTSPPHPLAMTLSAGRWKIVRTPKISQGTLNGVSCPAGTDCVAVGAAGTRPLAELWNGTRW